MWSIRNSEGSFVFRTWFGSYTNADIIDTGAYDSCHSEAYAGSYGKRRFNGSNPGLRTGGSNLILEELVSGR